MNKINRHISHIAAFVLLGFASVAQAQCAPGVANCLGNPLNSSFSTIPSFISGALKVMVELALPIIAVFIVIAGFRFVLARGNQGELSKAKMNFFYVIIGALLILGAWVIANLIGGTINQVIGTTS